MALYSCCSDPAELCAEKGGILAVGFSEEQSMFVWAPGAALDWNKLAQDLGPDDS